MAEFVVDGSGCSGKKQAVFKMIDYYIEGKIIMKHSKLYVQ